jgi:hypothetical protein
MNPIEHVWDFIGRKINQRNPKCQNIDELRIAILQEWQQFPQERLNILTFWIALVNFSANKVPYMLYRVHVWRHRKPCNCLNSLLL